MTNNPYLDIEQKMLGDIHTSREMMDNLEILCDDFGSRFGGGLFLLSPAMDRRREAHSEMFVHTQLQERQEHH